MSKNIPNIRKLKYIEKAPQRDWARRHEIRAAGLRALGFYSEPFLYPWFNSVSMLHKMLVDVKPKRRAALFRVARAAMKQGKLVKIQSLIKQSWLGENVCDCLNFASEHKVDLRKLKFSTPELDMINEKREKIMSFIKSQTIDMSEIKAKGLIYPVWLELSKLYK